VPGHYVDQQGGHEDGPGDADSDPAAHRGDAKVAFDAVITNGVLRVQLKSH
jgi:hypothetical protein